MLGQWQHHFPGSEPVAHLLRAAFPDRWVRFHSLPGSKRYPEGEDEYATVLARHNRILGDLLGPGRAVVLLTTGYSDVPAPALPPPELRPLDPHARLWRSVPLHERDGSAGPSYWHVFASEWEWQPGRFDPVVRLVADDVLRDVMVVPPDCRWLLHPYDGGMDVILESLAARGRLRAAYRDWLSPRADGL
jgi:hypothetical protein